MPNDDHPIVSKKWAAVRKLLADIGAAFGKLFKRREIDRGEGDRGGNDQSEVSAAVGLVVMAGVLVFGISIVWWYVDNWEEVQVQADKAYDELYVPAVEAYREWRINCEKLEAELVVDLECILDDNCMMTRDESVESQARQDAHKKYCVE